MKQKTKKGKEMIRRRAESVCGVAFKTKRRSKMLAGSDAPCCVNSQRCRFFCASGTGESNPTTSCHITSHGLKHDRTHRVSVCCLGWRR